MRISTMEYLIILFVCFLLKISHASDYANENTISEYANENTDNFSVSDVNVGKLDKWIFDKSFLLKVKDNYYSGNISNECKVSLTMYFRDLMSLKPWALEMFDASGKPPSSLLIGTLTDFGSMDECHRIKVHSDDVHFMGQFCMLQMRHPFFQPVRYKTENGRDYIEAFGHPAHWVSDWIKGDIDKTFGLYLAVCIPSTCTEKDFYNVINTIAEPTVTNVTITDCSVEKESIQLPLAAKISIFILSSILSLCVIGTYLDLHDRKNSEKNHQIRKSLNRDVLKSFSVYTNTETLFTAIATKSVVDCTNGIRSISCCYVIIGHFGGFPIYFRQMRYRNAKYGLEFVEPGWIMVLFNNGSIIVEPFFYLSGFFLMYTLWRRMERSGANINIYKILREYMYQRYLRLTPVHFVIITLSFILPFLSSGTIWNSTWATENAKCLKNGWKNILYMNNFDSTFEVCAFHTWYISVIMQLAVVFIPLIVVIYKYPKFGISISLIIWIGCLIHDYHMSIKYEFPFCTVNSMRLSQVVYDFGKIYSNPIFHFSSHLVGIFSGWIALNYKNQKLPKVWLYTGWFFCALCLVISLYAVYIPTTDLKISALYNTTKNTLFCLGLSWIVHLCVTRQAVVLNDFLSWEGFLPITKLSYSLYLINPILLILRDAKITERIYIDKISFVVEVLPYFFCTLLCGYIVYVTVEEPFTKICYILKSRLTIPSKPLHQSTNGNCSENANKKL